MDIVSIEMGIGMLLLFVIPIIYAVTNQSRKEKKTVKKVEALCGSNAVKLTSSTIFNTLFIGIDENSKNLVTSSVPVKEEHIDVFPLKDVNACNLFKLEVPKAGQLKATTIEKVAVELIFKDKEKKNHHIIFFDEEIGMDPHISVNQATTRVTNIRKNLN